MAVFSNTIITKKGHALVAKGMAGKQINFTKVRTSDYDYPSSTKFENLTVLGSIKQTVDISAVNIENESTVRVKAAILNTDLTSGYYVKNIGLYANDPDEGEILFSITTATTADFIPGHNGVNTSVLTVDLLTVVSNSGNVNLTVSPGGLVTTEMIASEENRGISNYDDWRKIESELSGAPYDGKFGTDLKEIKMGNSYLYVDENGKGVIYEAINNKTSTTGFLVPDTTNFINITNLELSKRLKRSYIQIENGGHVNLVAGQTWTADYGYSVSVSKVLAVRLVVDTWTNAYMDSSIPVLCFMNDKVGYKTYVKNYDLTNNGVHYAFEIECLNNTMRVIFKNLSNTLTLRMNINTLKLFY